MELGEKEHFSPSGSPAQLSAIASLNVPDFGAAVMEIIPLPPDEIVIADGLAPNATFTVFFWFVQVEV